MYICVSNNFFSPALNSIYFYLHVIFIKVVSNGKYLPLLRIRTPQVHISLQAGISVVLQPRIETKLRLFCYRNLVSRKEKVEVNIALLLVDGSWIPNPFAHLLVSSQLSPPDPSLSWRKVNPCLPTTLSN